MKIFNICLADTSSKLSLVLSGGISAGFPSPALDFSDVTIDLNKHLIKHPSSTFFGRLGFLVWIVTFL